MLFLMLSVKKNNTFRNYMYLESRLIFAGFVVCLLPVVIRIPLRRDVLDTTLCDQVCQWLAAGRCFFAGTPVTSCNNTDCHDITVILLKVALNTMTLLLCSTCSYYVNFFIITLFALLYVQVGVLLTRGKQLHHFTKGEAMAITLVEPHPVFFASFCDCDIWLWGCSQRMEFILLFSLSIF